MDIKAHEAMFFSDQCALLFPQVDRSIPEYVEQRPVLGGRQRQFQDISDEVRHHRTTAAPLRFEVTDVGDGHVVRELKVPIPFDIAIHHGRSESGSPPVPGIFVNPFNLS